VLAMASLGVYAVVLAGWSSGSNYPLLGAVRSTAQMISYEAGLGLALVAVLMYSGELSMSAIVDQQAGVFRPFDDVGALSFLDWVALPRWNLWAQFPAFVVFLICGIAETQRPPFDLPEAESELVAGYFTEYSGIKFAMFYLGEYIATVTIASIAVTLFLGGWRGPFYLDVLPWVWPLLWFVLKITAVIYVYILVRATFPRMRYDRLMNFGWKVLIPFGLVWVLTTAAVIVLPDRYGRSAILTALLAILGAVILISLLAPLVLDRRARREVTV